MERFLGLFALGAGVGCVGTLIGAGGGFLLMPVLLMLYPSESPEILTRISLAVVFANATAGSVSYARMKRIDYRSALLFAAASAPGAVLGAFTTQAIPRRLFDGIFGALMIAGAAFLFLKPKSSEGAPALSHPGRAHRELVERDGTRHAWSFRPSVGIVLSAFVGYASSLLGIGGGIIHVPALVYLLDFPVHVATATSHFILSIMALSGTAVHLGSGAFSHGYVRTGYLAAGALIGAPIGARLSSRLHGNGILRMLAVALALAGGRVALLAFRGE